MTTAFHRTAPSYTPVSDNDLIPELYQNRLLHWRDIFKMGYFDIGDTALLLSERAAGQGYKVSEGQVYAAVGRFCGKSGRTIRYYAEQAAFYSVLTRERYDMLPFSHFVFARSMGERWQEVLDYAALKPYITEEGLRMHFKGVMVAEYVEGKVNPMTEEDADPDEPRGEDKASAYREEQLPGRYVTHRVLSSLSNMVETLEYVMTNIKLSRESTVILRESLENIRKLLPEIVAKAGEK